MLKKRSPQSAAPTANKDSKLTPIPAPQSAAPKKTPELTWQEFRALDDYDRETASMFIHIAQTRRKGTSAPAEQFIFALVRDHSLHEPLTPDYVFDAAEEFKENYDMAVAISAEFIRLYPDAMREHVETVYSRLPAEGGN